MTEELTLTDFYRGIPVKRIWAAVFAIVIVFGGIFAGATGRRLIAENALGGPDDILQAAALYTFPLTLAVFLITLLFMTLSYRLQNQDGQSTYGGIVLFTVVSAAILWGAGQLAKLVGVGLLPDEQVFTIHGGWPKVLLSAFKAYLNAYGWPLAVCGVALGIGGALHAGHLWAVRQPLR